MPNWCQNQVKLTHKDPVVISRIQTAFTEGRLLEEFVPLGEWDYNLAVEKWGTKWDVGGENEYFFVEEDTIVLCFDSAWAPPVPVMEAIQAEGIVVEAYWYEPGMGYAGWLIDGEVEDFEYSDFADIPEEIVEIFGIEDWEELDS